MATINCGHCGSNFTQAQVDTVQCLICGGQTECEDGVARPMPESPFAPSPSAQRIMHAPGPNHGVDPATLQVGEVEWDAEGVEPEEVFMTAADAYTVA